MDKNFNINKFNKYEIDIFNAYNRKDSRSTDMTVYSNLLYLKEFGTLDKSAAEICKFINFKRKKHFKKPFALTTIKNSLNRLVANDLLIVISKGGSFKATFYEIIRAKKGKSICTKLAEKVAKHPIATGIENNSFNPTEKNIHNINTKVLKDKDYINTLTKLSYEYLITNESKVTTYASVKNHVEDAFKTYKLRSKSIQSEVKNRIMDNLDNITIKFAREYIFKAVLSAKLKLENQREQYKKEFILNKNKAISKAINPPSVMSSGRYDMNKLRAAFGY